MKNVIKKYYKVDNNDVKDSYFDNSYGFFFAIETDALKYEEHQEYVKEIKQYLNNRYDESEHGVSLRKIKEKLWQEDKKIYTLIHYRIRDSY